MNQKTITGVIALLALIGGIYAAIVIAPPGSDTASSASNELATQYLQQYPQPRELVDFSLTNHLGEPATKAMFLNKWTLLFVGYTYCPDICPTTLAAVNSAYPKLIESASEPLQVVFLSVDPNRDTIERLNQYMTFFNDQFIGMTGEHAQLFPLVRSMGMMYSMTESTDNPNYLVDHSASIVVINPKAQVIGRFKPQHKPGELAISDTAQILADLPIIMQSGQKPVH
ncbi:SCO family protein [Alteromonas facilis]|uniref:SCO family protein n=1 Tax=Alteromonas facilis TaxID=2048004 RepID=UPI000C28D520|nr:SCO family protein [Alteromonas facilis]